MNASLKRWDEEITSTSQRRQAQTKNVNAKVKEYATLLCDTIT